MANCDQLILIRGDSEPVTIIITDSNDVPVDITGATIYFTAKSNLNLTDAQAEIHLSQSVHTAPTQGTTKITIPYSVTSVLEPGEYFYDIQVDFGDGSIRSILKQKLSISSDVTRSQ